MTWSLESVTAEIRYPLPADVALGWWHGDYDALGASRFVPGPPPRIEIGEVLRGSIVGELQVVHEWGHAVDHADLDWTQRRALAGLWWGGLIEYHWGTPGTPYHLRAEEAFARWFMVAYGPERLRESSLTSMRSYDIDVDTMAEAMQIVGYVPTPDPPSVKPPPKEPRAVPKIAKVTTAKSRPGHRHNIRVSYRQAGRDPLSTAEAEGVRYWLDETETHDDPAFVVNACRYLLNLPPTV